MRGFYEEKNYCVFGEIIKEVISTVSSEFDLIYLRVPKYITHLNCGLSSKDIEIDYKIALRTDISIL